MTNTLHRYGDEHSLRNDFIVFAIPCRGHNDQDSVPKLQAVSQNGREIRPGEYRRRFQRWHVPPEQEPESVGPLVAR